MVLNCGMFNVTMVIAVMTIGNQNYLEQEHGSVVSNREYCLTLAEQEVSYGNS